MNPTDESLKNCNTCAHSKIMEGTPEAHRYCLLYRGYCDHIRRGFGVPQCDLTQWQEKPPTPPQVGVFVSLWRFFFAKQ